MSRRASALPSPISDEPSVPLSAAERWQQLFGTTPPDKASTLVEQAVAWAEQARIAGDVPQPILRDLRILAHQLRTARLDRRAGGELRSDSASCTPSPDAIGRTLRYPESDQDAAAACSAPCAISPKPMQGTMRLAAAEEDPTSVPPVREQTRRASPAPLLPASSQLGVGARLVKIHHGVTHVVEVTSDGMLYQGQLFASLSAVARAITGTHWNGLLFFGLRRRKTYARKAAARG